MRLLFDAKSIMLMLIIIAISIGNGNIRVTGDGNLGLYGQRPNLMKQCRLMRHGPGHCDQREIRNGAARALISRYACS